MNGLHLFLPQWTNEPPTSAFAAVRVRVADGGPQRIGDKGMSTCPARKRGWKAGGAVRANKNTISPTRPQRSISKCPPRRSGRARFASGRQQLTKEHGLDHFGGRLWHGLLEGVMYFWGVRV
jgi:hypothetical protein